jgi:hypothetical protein
MENQYKVDPKMSIPVILAMISAIVLIAIEGFTNQGLLLVVVLIPFFYLGAEILSRKIVFLPDGITIKKFLRSVNLKWVEIQSLDAIQSGNKLFMILVNEKTRPVLITNTIAAFGEMANRLISSLPPGKVTDQARQILSAPPAKYSTIFQAWVVLFIIIGLILGKFYGL